MRPRDSEATVMPMIGYYALAALFSITLANAWFGNRSLQLNRSLNNRLEHEVTIVASNVWE